METTNYALVALQDYKVLIHNRRGGEGSFRKCHLAEWTMPRNQTAKITNDYHKKLSDKENNARQIIFIILVLFLSIFFFLSISKSQKFVQTHHRITLKFALSKMVGRNITFCFDVSLNCVRWKKRISFFLLRVNCGAFLYY